MARSLNKVQLIGNLTRDPEMRFTPNGTGVCTFGMATNRQWKTESGEMRDEAEFHRIVAWNQLAEICNKLLKKGDKVFVEGRIQSRDWQGQDGQKRTTVEIVINEMLLLDSKGGATQSDEYEVPEDFGESEDPFSDVSEETPKSSKKKSTPPKKEDEQAPEAEDDDIPF